MPNLILVTLNLLDDERRRWERLDLAVSEIKRLRPDVVLLQEVNLVAGVEKKLAKLLPDYVISICRLSGNSSGIALVTLSRQKPLAEDRLALSQDRVAQKITFKIGSRKVNFVNVHLYFSPLRDKARRQQVAQLLDFAGQPTIVAGDFNAMPAYKSMKMMQKRFNSAYRQIFGHEPLRTYPSPLWRGTGTRHELRRQALKVIEAVTGRLNQDWGGTIDYIFAGQGIKATSCSLAFDKPSPDDKQLYASDHFGLVAGLTIE